MTLNKFIRNKQNEAITALKEDSAVIFLLEYVLNMTSPELYSNLDNEISEDNINKFNELFNEYLYNNKPIQYLIGKTCFYGYDFIVNSDVLIPRFETEELVENIIYRIDKYFKEKTIDIVDVGTGSGCIAITLAKEIKNSNVTATDISEKALDVAKQNALNLGVNINFLEGDMLEPIHDKFDILVSNPPYIPDSEIVDPLVKDNEPNIALFGGNNGLKFYEIILRDAKRILKDRAIICFEHGYDKKEEMHQLAKKYFPLAFVETLKDLEGKDRMTFIYIGDDFNE